MKIWTYCVFHNEAPMLPFFLRHYAPLSERVILFDDHSTDLQQLQESLNGGRDWLLWRQYQIEIQSYSGAGLDDMAFVEFASREYKQARGQADWIIWVDADEFIYHPDLKGVLERYRAQGVNLARTQGYAMWADHFPAGAGQIYDLVRTGVPYDHYSKPVVIDPRLEITWHAGKHGILTGHHNVRESREVELKLLHYRHLGAEYFAARNARNYARMSADNIARGLGFQTYPERQAELGWDAQQVHFQRLEQVVP